MLISKIFESLAGKGQIMDMVNQRRGKAMVGCKSKMPEILRSFIEQINRPHFELERRQDSHQGLLQDIFQARGGV